MPLREEKVAQIEAALRNRFFPHVPKLILPERKGWKPEQHDTDRLTRALAAYALVKHCRIDDLTATGAIVDGSDDGGIDAIYFDRSKNHLIFVQSKFKRGGESPSQDEVLKTLNGVKRLHKRRFNGFNAAVQAKLDEIEAALDMPGAQLHILMVYLGDNFNKHAKDDLSDFCDECSQGSLGTIAKWHEEGLDQLYNWLIVEQTPKEIAESITMEHWGSVSTPHRAYYGQVKAADLAKMVEKHGGALFERNIRYYLGSSGVNSAIERAVRLRPQELFYLNNGITAVAHTVTPAPGTRDRCVFSLAGLSIVNGAQTAGALITAMLNGQISPDARLLITIIELGDEGEKLGTKITRARNHQNIVRGIEFAALDPAQERLRRELAVAGVTYYYRPSADAKARQEDACTIEEAAVALACLGFTLQAAAPTGSRSRPQQANALAIVVAAKAEVSRLWDQEGDIYKRLFTPKLSGVRMYRLVLVYRFIDRILAAREQSEDGYERRMFFRHARYFTMAVIALRARVVLDQPRLTLDDADITVLSRLIDELAELIYTLSLPLQGIKGYRAIFRNLTDAQPLADAVLRRFEEQEQRHAATPLPDPAGMEQDVAQQSDAA